MRIALILISFLLYCRQTPENITLRTISGDSIVVTEDIIYYNNNPISDKIDGIIYKSNYNRLIEQSGIILLFLEVDDRPSYNKLKAFKLTKQKANALVECVYNDKTQGIGPAPFTDMDKDGKIEFGGFDITEVCESKDSMYYNPSNYYEINNGAITRDSSLTKKMDIKVNGIYLPKPLDENGFCCIIIKKPPSRNKQ